MKKHKLRFSSRTANAQKQTNSAPLSFFRVRCRLAGRQKTTKPEKFRKFPRTFKSPKQSNLAPSANRSRCVVLCQKTLKKMNTNHGTLDLPAIVENKNRHPGNVKTLRLSSVRRSRLESGGKNPSPSLLYMHIKGQRFRRPYFSSD